MVAVTYTVAFHGVKARPVEVQCAVAPGLPSFQIVGLANKAVSEPRLMPSQLPSPPSGSR